jgi:GDP-mannose 6-dehydrogenase
MGVDVDPAKLQLIREGKTPVVEEGMVELMSKVVASGRVSVTNDTTDALRRSEVSLICVGTPSATNGSQDQGAVLRLASELGEALASVDHVHTFVFRSTLVPGTVEGTLTPVIEHGRRTRLFRLFQPGSARRFSIRILTTLHSRSSGQWRSRRGVAPCSASRATLRTSVRAAEMVKYCCNNFHALKITFATRRRDYAVTRADPEVMDLVCRDLSSTFRRRI